MAKGAEFELSVARPCEESWEAMRREGRSRFCEACGKSVQDLSRMTEGEVRLLAMRAAAGEALCGRVTRRGDGSVVTLGPGQRGARARGVVLSAALAAGLPSVAQSVKGAGDSEIVLKEVAPEPQSIPGKAVVIGRLLHPDGRRVDTGLVFVQSAQDGTGPLYVVDESGWFEIHATPGVYNFVVQTGKDQVERVRGVVLHEGVQEFADIRTRSGQQSEMETTITVGELVGIRTRWGWGALRHPVLYARYLARRMQ